MTQPYYTATQGPADPNAPAVQKVYAVVSSLLGLFTLASTFHLITTEQAGALSNVGTSAVGLIGASIAALAAFRTKKQLNNGTFDAAPTNAVGTVFEQLGAIKQKVDDTVAHTTAQVADATAAIQGAVAMIPGGSLVTGAVLSGPVGDLIQAISDHQEKN